jgi:hypothetical protein
MAHRRRNGAALARRQGLKYQPRSYALHIATRQAICGSEMPSAAPAPHASITPTRVAQVHARRRSKRELQSAPPLEVIARSARWPAVLEGVVQELVGSLQAALQLPSRKHCEPCAG